MWSYVSKKAIPDGYGTHHRRTGQVLAYVFGRRNDEAFQLKRLLEPFGIKRFCTDGWVPIKDI